MKNKGMHQQPNAFTPSTGTSAPQNKNLNKGGYQPGHTGQGHGHANPPPSWNKPQTAAATTAVPQPAAKGGGKGFQKSGKKAA